MSGKVTGIAKFGAFVSLAPGKSGLVHISEIANTYVNDIAEFLKEGQDVRVKILSIDEMGRINLSIKQAMPSPERKPFQSERKPVSQERRAPMSGSAPPSAQEVAPPSADASFEDKLKRFMQASDSKISGLYSDRKTSRRRRGQ